MLIPYFKLKTSQFNISKRSNSLELSPYKTKHLTSLARFQNTTRRIPGILICKQFYGWKIKKKYGISSQPISPTNRLANCLWSPNFKQKKSEKLQHRPPGILHFWCWFHAIALQKLSNERSYKFSWILTLTEVISIRILRMRLISAIVNFYCPLKTAQWSFL